MAPWSLLAPLFFIAHLRPAAPQWIASGLTAILSITVFSLIAGKEHDYILPAYAFAAVAFGGVLAAASRGAQGWEARYASVWASSMMAVLGIGALGMAGYATWLYDLEPAALITIWIGAAAVLTALWGLRSARRRAWGVAIATVLLSTQFHMLSGLRTGGTRSMQDIAQAVRELREMDLQVEASEVRPATAFYLRTPISVVQDPQTIARRIQGPEPYYYLCRARDLAALRSVLGKDGFQLLAGYYTQARYALIGNRPLPKGIGGNLRLEVLEQNRTE
jgi:hypothetical protein